MRNTIHSVDDRNRKRAWMYVQPGTAGSWAGRRLPDRRKRSGFHNLRMALHSIIVLIEKQNPEREIVSR
ncbi:MAG: hypothetical protein WA705_00910 [Candidatus Ozemobacteraceae bacterium]